MYKANIANNTFEVLLNTKASLDGNPVDITFHRLPDQSYTLHYKGRVHSADLVHVDHEKKTVTLRIAGKKFSVQLKEPVDQLLDQLGISSKVAKKLNKLSAPMPGLVLNVFAEVGKSYQAGEALMVLEAMKMENVFKAADQVIVKEVLVNAGQSVDKGQVMIVFV